MSILGIDLAWYLVAGIVFSALMAAFYLGRWHMYVEMSHKKSDDTEDENEIINDDFSHVKRTYNNECD